MSNQENYQEQTQFPAQQELKHLRTRCGKVYALGNNRFRAVVQTTPVHEYDAATHQWVELSAEKRQQMAAQAHSPIATFSDSANSAENAAGILDTYVKEGSTQNFSHDERLWISNTNYYGNRLTYLKVVDLPRLGANHFITSAKLCVRNVYAPTADTAIMCKEVLKDWDPETITYDCPQLESILEPTYGCIVYQEQVMQIVRDLAGYSLGRSDLLRRAMSKKKAAVMEKERKIFIYGDEETGVPGCIKNGIDEQTANKIYDEMIDFAKYAFNKSHAAAYAVVSYQTAWLKYYFPVEYMAALMTSVIDNPSKVSEYIYACRQMNIKILPPDINKGEANFSVDGGDIRYGLAAIKSIGRPVIKAIVEDREELGLFQNLEDFITRLSAKNILNKRTIENLIKAGALDTLGGTRKQFMSIYVQIVDHVTQEKKNSMVGQMTLFDLVSEDQKEEFQIRMPDVGEYSKETLLAFEKEVLGIYVSGHPLEAYEEKWKKSISATTADFQLDEETGHTKVHDGAKEIIGGMITEKTIKHTKTNQMMAFITVEDLLGTVEVVVFPRDYEKNRDYLEVDSKVFVRGRVSEEDDKPSKMICEKIIPFERTKKELWIQFPDKATFLDEEQIVYGYLADSDGDDEVMIYCAKERAVKKLPKNRNIGINEQILSRLMNHFGEKRVKVVEKPIENIF